MELQSVLKILNVNLKRNFLPHFAIAIIIALLTPVVFGISSLDASSAARPVEMLLSLTGTVLLTPIFLPEQDENIRDLIRSKRTDYTHICIIRVIYSVIALAAIIGVFVIVMYCCESIVTVRHFVGGFASALFLGAIGFFTAAVSGNTPVGYMTSLLYYIANICLKDKLGKLYIFSMSAGSFEGKYEIFAVSVVLIVMGLVFSEIYWKR
jgi:hypothetical protein